MKKTVSIICPLYNAEKYVLELNKNLLKQKDVDIKEIKYIYTESNDNTEQILNDNKIKYEKITKK